jgi:hypothetical protein
MAVSSFSTKALVLGLLSASSLAYVAHPRDYNVEPSLELDADIATTSSAVEFATTSSAAPSAPTQAALKLTVNIPDNIQPIVDSDFPDPAIIQGPDGKWWAFGTSSGGGPNVRVASADDPAGPWTYDPDQDAKPDLAWTSTRNTWAPDVQKLAEGEYVLYYSAPPADNSRQCLGAARSSNVQGPYVPLPEPLMCRQSIGGVIDVSGFLDPTDGRRYITYKIDGGGVDVAGVNYTTPIFVREVSPDDGTTFLGDEVLINYRLEEDGPLVEAPQIVYRDGHYIHLFSSHAYYQDEYDTKYAVADNVMGPYVRGGQLIAAGMGGLLGPGGAQAVQDDNSDVIVFHGICHDREARCLYVATFSVEQV